VTTWMLKQTYANIEQIANEMGIESLIAHILAIRGYRQKSDIDRFLFAERYDLASPTLLADMDKAVTVVAESIINGKSIAIFGDYDSDGIMSTVILHKTIQSLGGRSSYYIPERDGEGYGLNSEAIFNLRNQGAELLIACDNGISAIEQIGYANELGMQCVVLDHHDLQYTDEKDKVILPPAVAVVDPKRLDCNYPFKVYCAAAVCYRFAEALYQKMARDWQPLGNELLPFVTIATITDLVELIGENRIIVKKGLSQLSAARNIGLKALIDAVGLAGKDLGVYHVAYIIGPCINASGRLGTAYSAVELLLCDNELRAKELSNQLVALNITRKKLTEEGFQAAIAQITENSMENDKIIVIHCPDTHESVAGIIAGKLKEKYGHPVVVCAGNKDILRGSCRSIEGYNICAELSNCRDLLVSFGGHPMAAGLSLYPKNVTLLRRQLNDNCHMELDQMTSVVRIDKQYPVSDATISLANRLRIFEPYGNGNLPIYFADKDVQIVKIKLLGKEQQVVRLICRSKDYRQSVVAVAFNSRSRIEELIKNTWGEHTWNNLLSGKGRPIVLDLIYSIGTNYFNDKEHLQLQVIDFRLATIANEGSIK